MKDPHDLFGETDADIHAGETHETFVDCPNEEPALTDPDDVDFDDVDPGLDDAAEPANALVVINQRFTETVGYVEKLLGNKLSPVQLTDEKALTAAQENISTVKDLENAVVDHFKPIKEQARRPYQDAIDAAPPEAPYRLPAGHHLVAGHYVLRFDA